MSNVFKYFSMKTVMMSYDIDVDMCLHIFIVECDLSLSGLSVQPVHVLLLIFCTFYSPLILANIM
jgi:hypothetical protein